MLENDKRAILTAAAHAQRAADFLHGLQSLAVGKSAAAYHGQARHHHHRGHAFSWQRICDLRRAQLEAWRAGQVRQLTLFELKDDSRPSAELCARLAAFEASRRFRP